METLLRLGRLARLIHARINPPHAIGWCYNCHTWTPCPCSS
jgi:hypothetical protein